MENLKFFLTIYTLALCLFLASCNQCFYSKFTPDHSACKPANPSCEVTDTGIGKADQEAILKMHNEYRQKIANGEEKKAGGMPEAANMEEMEWDDELAEVAQKLTDQCNFAHDCNECRQVERFQVGQNIYISYSSNPDPTDYSAMMAMWYDEVNDYKNSMIKPFQPGQSGHFTQLVWSKSNLVGCGRTIYKSNGMNTALVACNYGPGGNFMNGEMYQAGKACSACPSGTACSSKYPGLCK